MFEGFVKRGDVGKACVLNVCFKLFLFLLLDLYASTLKHLPIPFTGFNSSSH